MLSLQGKGLFTLGTFSAAFGTLGHFTPKAADIYERLRKDLLARNAAEYPPGLREQLELHVDRYRPHDGCAFNEIAFVPGFSSAPSMLHSSSVVRS